jgi:peptidoglycan/xylan/chitin deacetylase (PgdA/CDA1 family)
MQNAQPANSAHSDNRTVVTTSWDDGHPSDLAIAELLHSHNLTGTFYVPQRDHRGNTTIGTSGLRSLYSAGFEIGAHTVSHRALSGLANNELDYELSICKQTLEQILGDEVSMFCYPKGRYDATVIKAVMRAGFRGARTTQMLSLSARVPPFQIPTTIQAYPHPTLGYLKNIGRNRDPVIGLRYLTQLSRSSSWVDIGKRLFDTALARGGVWHLYGHSWEIEEANLWDEVREMLSYVSHRDNVSYLNNGELLSPSRTPQAIC